MISMNRRSGQYCSSGSEVELLQLGVIQHSTSFFLDLAGSGHIGSNLVLYILLGCSCTNVTNR